MLTLIRWLINNNLKLYGNGGFLLIFRIHKTSTKVCYQSGICPLGGAERTIVSAMGASQVPAITERRRPIAAAMAAGRAGIDVDREFGASANWVRWVAKEING